MANDAKAPAKQEKQIIACELCGTCRKDRPVNRADYRIYDMAVCVACCTLVSMGIADIEEGYPCGKCGGVCDERIGDCKDTYHDKVEL